MSEVRTERLRTTAIEGSPLPSPDRLIPRASPCRTGRSDERTSDFVTPRSAAAPRGSAPSPPRAARGGEGALPRGAAALRGVTKSEVRSSERPVLHGEARGIRRSGLGRGDPSIAVVRNRSVRTSDMSLTLGHGTTWDTVYPTVPPSFQGARHRSRRHLPLDQGST